MQTAGFALRRVIQQICNNSTDSIPIILDATKYLYVSTNVAMKFPDLMESAVILSYRTYLPGEVAKKWKFEYAAPESCRIPFFGRASGPSSTWRNITVMSVVVSLLQLLGAQNPMIQRSLVHTVQPILATVLLLFIAFLVSHPLYALVIIPFFGYFGYTMYDNCRRENETNKSENASTSASITPQLQPQEPSSSQLVARVHSELSLPHSSSVAPSDVDVNSNRDEDSRDGGSSVNSYVKEEDSKDEDAFSSLHRPNDWSDDVGLFGNRTRAESVESVDSSIAPYRFMTRSRNFSYSSQEDESLQVIPVEGTGSEDIDEDGDLAAQWREMIGKDFFKLSSSGSSEEDSSVSDIFDNGKSNNIDDDQEASQSENNEAQEDNRTAESTL